MKFIFTPEPGVHSFVWDEALNLAGQDPDFHRKDFWEAIENGAYPKWKFGIQLIPEANEQDFEFDILDATKAWSEDLVPIRYIISPAKPQIGLTFPRPIFNPPCVRSHLASFLTLFFLDLPTLIHFSAIIPTHHGSSVHAAIGGAPELCL